MNTSSYQPSTHSVTTLTEYAIGFHFLNAGQVKAFYLNSSWVQTDLIYTSGTPGVGEYTVSVEEGLLTWNDPVSGSTLVIYRETPPTQTYNLQNNGVINADLVEASMDRISMASQEIEEDQSRTLKWGVEDSGCGLTFPPAEQMENKFVAIDGSCNIIPADGVSSVPVSPYMATVVDDLSASAARTTLGALGTDETTAYTRTLLDDIDASEAQTTLGISPYIKTLIDDSDAAAARATLEAINKTEVAPNIINVTANTTLSNTKLNQLVKAVKQASDITITLPDSSSVSFSGQTIVIDVTGAAAGGVLMATTSSQTIDGLTPGNYDFAEPGQKTFVSDGANWISKRDSAREALAWVNFNGTGTVAIRSSYNVSSITDNGTGDYTVNFTNALPNADYAVCFGTNDAPLPTHGALHIDAANAGAVATLKSTTQLRIVFANGVDLNQSSVIIFGG